MGKRKRGSTENSKESTPVASDSDDPSPRGRRHKAAVKSAVKKRDKTSAELCEEYKVTNVDLEYTEADYQNLTTFSFFVRMVRPQISAANPRVGASKMTSILETKWKEFREAKKVFDQQKKGEKEKLEAEKARQVKEAAEKVKQQVAEKEEEDSDEDTEIEVDDEPEHDSTKAESAEDVAEPEVDSTKESEDSAKSDHDSEEESEEEIKPQRKAGKKRASFGPLRIKMPIPMRKSGRNRKSSQKAMTDKDFAKLIGSEDEDGWNSDDDKPRKKRSKKKADSDADFDTDEDDDFQEKPTKKKKVPTATLR